jgi:hypothetical protein
MAYYQISNTELWYYHLDTVRYFFNASNLSDMVSHALVMLDDT